MEEHKSSGLFSHKHSLLKELKEVKLERIIEQLRQFTEEREKQLRELDRIAKMLVRRDLELQEIREKRETELEELRRKTKELETTRLALMNILEDVDEARLKAEEERRKTLAIINHFVDGILVFDKDNKIALINPQTEKFFKVKPEEVIGKSLSQLRSYPFLKKLEELIGEEIKKIYRKELHLSEKLILEVSVVPIILREEKIATILIFHDVTREKLIERMKSEFVSIAAHQLRTPLSALKWTLKMLLEGDLGPITQEQAEFVEKIYNANERMIRLINDLLDVTRIEEGRYVYKLSLVKLDIIIEKMILFYKDLAEKKKLKIEFKKEGEDFEVRVDEEKIKLAIQNLVENAIRYTLPQGEIMISLKRREEEIEFSIKDTGVGIPEHQKERVFSKFFRGENVMRIETEGTGLGLFITKNIIESHGGKIWFESEEGKGTTFYFTLPISQEKK